MRILFVHAILILLIRNFCISQFHQDDYDIEQDRIEILEYNKTAITNLSVKVFKYNETLRMKAINITIYLIPGVRKSIPLTATIYKNVQKKYRPFPIPNITVDLCEAYDNIGSSGNILGTQNGLKRSNFRGCPTGKGLYFLKAWVIEQEKFFPHLPGGDYMIRIHAAIDDMFMLVLQWYGSIVKKQKKKKN